MKKLEPWDIAIPGTSKIQVPWQAVWEFLNKLNIKLP
jgi:carbon monoxide dehydrogenase subunit G